MLEIRQITVTSRDGQIRSVKVSLCSGRVNARQRNLLHPVEASNKCVSEHNKNDRLNTPRSSASSESEVKERPVRVSAKHAREKIKRVLSQ